MARERKGQTASEVLYAAAAYLERVAESLPQGTAYSPPGYLLQLQPITSAEPGDQRGSARTWPLSSVSLSLLASGGAQEIVLRPAYLAALVRTGAAYHWLLVREGKSLYRVRWRPLYPHEW